MIDKYITLNQTIKKVYNLYLQYLFLIQSSVEVVNAQKQLSE